MTDKERRPWEKKAAILKLEQLKEQADFYEKYKDLYFEEEMEEKAEKVQILFVSLPGRVRRDPEVTAQLPKNLLKRNPRRKKRKKKV